MAPEALAHVLRPLHDLFDSQDHPDLLVGLGLADDAAVYRLSDGSALVATLDFFTPIVDDPYAYGAIAAANAMSDVYAMGGQVLFALNVAAFPANLPPDMITEVLRGGAEKVREAGAVVAGGHTIQDKEPKYGLVVLGRVDPGRILTKGGARPGDQLILTKPLGSGVITTAFMRDRTSKEQLQAATESMLRLNRLASEVALAAGVRAATDVTGFGLLGHASEMLVGSDEVLGPAESPDRGQEGQGAGFRLYFDRLPWLPGAQAFGDDWVYPGGAFNNRDYFKDRVRFDSRLSEAQQVLCFSPETSGGLLMAVPPGRVEEVVGRLERAWAIGEVVAMAEPAIEVVL
jgi:selenide,water dikinase